MLIAHVHDGCGLAPIGLVAKETLEIFLDQGCNPANGPLLTGAVLATIALTLHTAH